MNTKLIFILTISLIVKIVSYFVFPDHISILHNTHCSNVELENILHVLRH